LRIRSIKPEFYSAGRLDPERPGAWKEIGPAPLGKTFVYRFFDCDGQLLYVGITWNPWVRWREHRAKREWWSRVDRYDLHVCQDERDARTWETWCIRTLHPICNKHQNPGWHRAAN
jgi:hypothetical protein